MACLAYWGVIDYMEVFVLENLQDSSLLPGTTSRNFGWEREPQITKITDNIGFANVFEGWSPKNIGKTNVFLKSMVFKPCGWEHPIHG